ncbi:MAG: serine hydrolase [Gammaproteobacteria bacterium]|nr:serine hydrolase [Gammaproteobacteria bacterium]
MTNHINVIWGTHPTKIIRISKYFLLLPLLLSLVSHAADPSDYYYPPTTVGDTTWNTESAASLGWDAIALAAAVTYADQQDSTALVILHKGNIVSENYWDGWDLHTKSRIQSAHKTMGGFLFGVAQQEGLVTREDFVSSYLNNWSTATAPQEAVLTIAHLQTMISGMSEQIFLGLINYDVAPDTQWSYNTTAYHLMGDIIGLQNPDGDYDQFVQSRLYDLIGMNDSVPFNGVIAKTSENSARDMARFGLMMLGNGTWDGVDIIQDKTYLAEMTVASQSFNEAYGNLTWLNGGSVYVLPGDITAAAGELIPEAPADLYAALGAGDKKIYVVPSLDLVVVRHGPAAPDGGGFGPSGFDNTLWQMLCLAMNDCLPSNAVPPGDVTAFSSAAGDTEINLTWDNPLDADFAGVRIRRATGSAPAGPNDGVLVYEAAGTAFTDSGLTNGTTYFYSAFAYDAQPNYADGVSTSTTPATVGGSCTDWTEDFALAFGTIVDNGATAWSIDDSDLTMTGSGDFFEVRNNEFRARDIDGVGIWSSEIIETGGADFVVSVTIRESGRMESTDYIQLSYLLNGAPEVVFANISNDFGSAGITINTPTLMADTVQIIVRASNNGGTEMHRWDQVSVDCL